MKENILNHEIIGELEWDRSGYGEDYYCDRDFEFLGKICKFVVYFVSYGEKTITDQQIQDYLYFMENNELILKKVSNAILGYYHDCYEDMDLDERDFDLISSEDELIPLLGDLDDKGEYVIIPSIYIKLDRDYIGFSVGCEWDMDNGLGIKIINGEIDDIGPHSIVL